MKPAENSKTHAHNHGKINLCETSAEDCTVLQVTYLYQADNGRPTKTDTKHTSPEC